MVVLFGTLVNAGGVVSLNVTVTSKLLLPVLPWLSVAVHVTVVVPTGKLSPELWLHVGVSEPSTVSLAVAGLHVTTAVPPGVVVVPLAPDGTETVGGVVSWTVMWNDASSASGAEHVTVVVPMENVSPLLWSHEAVSSFGVTVTANVTEAPLALVASAVMSEGTLMTWPGGSARARPPRRAARSRPERTRPRSFTSAAARHGEEENRQ
jgi:hypothetical protein